MAAPDGLLIVDKPTGWSSHDVVSRCRRLAATRKVGHAGTLDPMATGVLVVGVGRATRLLGYLALTTKAYQATMRLGQRTVTDDADGDVLETLHASTVTDTELAAAVWAHTGDLLQVPSAVSAIKVDGERAYNRVRAGEDVKLAARPVTVSRFDIAAVRRTGGFLDVDVTVECSTGTYIRALARDVGSQLAVGGHLTALRRTRVGPHLLTHARTLDELARHSPGELPMVSMNAAAVQTFPTYQVDEAQVFAVRNGQALPAGVGGEGPVAVMSPTGTFLALYEQRGPVLQALAVFDPA